MGCHYVAYSTLQGLPSGVHLIFPRSTPDSSHKDGHFRPVILSAAKNLGVAGEILRCAQNDRFGSLLFLGEVKRI